MSELCWLGVDELQSRMQAGDLTAETLVLALLERIAAIDSAEGGLNSILEINPDALAIARSLDRERTLHGARGPLHGIPVVLKDNIDTADKMHTSAGSLALKDSSVSRDAFIVARLRAAGAILLGKANMTEWANFMTDNMPNGYSSRGGQVRNPYGPGRFDTGGSSSGSAVSVAAGLTPLAVGTETSGSILSPASQNSVVGIKPTLGLVSRSGVIPIAHSQDTAGPMARSVRDAALLLGVLAAHDEMDPLTGDGVARRPHDYREALRPGALKGARLGVPRSYYEKLTPEKRARIDEAIASLRTAGAEILDPVEITSAKKSWRHDVLTYEFKADLNAYLGRLGPGAPVHSLGDLVAFNRSDPERTLRYGQTHLESSEATSGRLTEPAYIEALLESHRWSRADGIDAVMAAHHLDALLFCGPIGADIAARAGYPSVTVPAGYTSDGEPVGLTFCAEAYSEPRLLALAHDFEQGHALRRNPR